MSNLKDVKHQKKTITLNDGVEREVKFTLNAMAELEDRYGSIEAAFTALEGNSVKAARFILWAVLSSSDPSLTEQQVGNLIDVENMNNIMDSLAGAFEQDLPDQDTKQIPNS